MPRVFRGLSLKHDSRPISPRNPGLMTEFKVTNQSTGREFQVLRDETVLDSILREGFAVPYSCRNGTCAACKSTLVSGKVNLDEYDKAALTDEELADGEILLCRARPVEDLVIEASEIQGLVGIQIQKLPCRVQSLGKLAHDVMKVELVLPPQTKLNYIAGQYIDIMMRDGKRRGFSIANPHGESTIVLHVRHVPRGRFTTHIFNAMNLRDVLHFEGPLGTFFLRTESELPIVFVAGGTGFAPVQCILQDAFEKGIKRPMHLFWGVRSLRDLYLHEQALEWSKRFGPQFRYTPVLSEPLPDDSWSGKTGWVHESVLDQFGSLDGYEVYASGPPPMIEIIRTVFPEHGLEPANLFYDSFEFSTDTLYPRI